MELNLFSFIIYSLNILTITSNFVYSSALSIDKEVKEANPTVKWNITEVKVPNLEEQEKEDGGDYGIKVKVPKNGGIVTSDDKNTDKFPGVPLSILEQLPEFDPCMTLLRECHGEFWPWCEVVNGTVRCICIHEYYRPRPICKPTCTIDSECDADMWCLYGRCRKVCPGYCGTNAQCDVINHQEHCSCPPGLVGDPPYVECHKMNQVKIPTPCDPNPCGKYSQCKEEDNDVAVCKCLPNSIGRPPNCIRKCTNHSECYEHRACIDNLCTDKCHACGNDAQCQVHNNIPYCTCLPYDNNDICSPMINCQIIHEAMDPTFGYKQYPIMAAKFDPTELSSKVYGLKTERDALEWKKKNNWPYNISPVPHPDFASCVLSTLVAPNCPSDTARINGQCARIDE